MFLKFLEKLGKNEFPVVIGAASTVELLRNPVGTRGQSKPCDVVEARLDLLGEDPFSSQFGEAVAECPLPILFTARHPFEGGAGDLDAITREKMLRHHLPKAWGIDIELRSFPEMAGLAQEAREAGVAVIGSFHNFQETPKENELQDVIMTGVDLGVDVVKIAVQLQTPGDLARLIDLFEAPPNETQIAVMGMGELGKVSRLVLAQCGSALSYGFLGESNVHGQWPADQFIERLNDFEN